MHEHLIAEHMTQSPLTIGKDQPLARAHEIMRAHHVRHLPVLHGGAIVGLVTERDLHLLETLRDVRPEEVPVEDAMTPDPYTVSPDTPLADVAEHMAEHKYGAAVVVQRGHVVGVFTAVDGLKLLARMLREAPDAGHPARAAPRAPAKKKTQKKKAKAHKKAAPARKTRRAAARTRRR